MGIQADLFVAAPEDALRYDALVDGDTPLPPDAFVRVQSGGFTPLEPEMLWAILLGEPWDPERHLLEHTTVASNGERWLCRFPDQFVSLLAGMDEATMERAAEAWSDTEELQCDPDELAPVLRDLQRLAALAREKQKSLYLWGSL
jgi:hypothetical protein